MNQPPSESAVAPSMPDSPPPKPDLSDVRHVERHRQN
jgi:hypothetical protein